MSRTARTEVDEVATALVAHTFKLLEQHDWVPAELARRINMSESSVSRYLHPDSRPNESGFRFWPSWLIVRVAFGFGLTAREFLDDLWGKHSIAVAAMMQDPTELWDPRSDSASAVTTLFGRHEDRSDHGIGFFRIPPCPIQVHGMAGNIYRNLFADMGEVGGRIVAAYNEIDAVYGKEYRDCGGHYGDFRLITLVFDGEIRKLIRGEGEYFGCQNLAISWLEDLEEVHIKRMGYTIGFVDETKAPPDIVYDLADADSLIIVGTTLSVRRMRGTLRLRPETGGDQLRLDQLQLRALADGYADLSKAGMLRKVEKFKNYADELRRGRHQVNQK